MKKYLPNCFHPAFAGLVFFRLFIRRREIPGAFSSAVHFFLNRRLNSQLIVKAIQHESAQSPTFAAGCFAYLLGLFDRAADQ
jgi:hypothetical protein